MEPITIEVARENRFICLVGSHRLGIVCPDRNKIMVGRGSIGVLNNVRYYHQKVADQPVLEVGDYCETSLDCTVLVGGEHDNRSAWNLVYAGLPVVSQMATSAAGHPLARSKGATVIGSNVVLSYGSLVVSGSQIGSGAVIAANAVVAGVVPPRTIWAGNPGCARPRFKTPDEEDIYSLIDWANLRVVDLLGVERMTRNADGPALRQHFSGQEPERDCRLWFDATTKMRKVELRNMLGVTIGGRFIKPSQFPKPFIDYFKQANEEGNAISWVPDAFEYFWK